MLKINKILVKDFYSIGTVSLYLKEGVHYVVGVNKDISSAYNSSNGSGKTATFAALYQGLFNKNIKNTKGLIESVNNSITGNPYFIQVDFTKLNHEYSVINDRSHNKIIIKKDGFEVQPKGIVNQLKMIKNLLGLDFETFSSLTYISQGTLQAILDTTNKDNVLYQFFNIDSIKKTDAALKDERRNLKTEKSILITRLRALEKSISLLLSFTKIDVESLEKNLAGLKDSLLLLSKDKRHTQLSFMRDRKEKLSRSKTETSDTIMLLEKDIEDIQRDLLSMKNGKCPVCKGDFTDESHKKKLELNLISAKDARVGAIEKQNELLDDITSLTKKINELNTALQEEESSLLNKVNLIQSKLLVVKEQNSQYEKISQQQDQLESEKLEIFQSMGDVDRKLLLVENSITIIKDGALVNAYLNKFKNVFSAIISELTIKTSFNLSIEVYVNKGKLDYKFIDNGSEKPYNDLSAGEKTRVSLLLLISTLLSLEKVVGISSNYLVIDEMLGVLDEEGIKMIEKFIDILRSKKAIYLITHHQEIPIDFFDSEISFEKVNGITSLINTRNITREII